jgi:hypothetical protein
MITDSVFRKYSLKKTVKGNGSKPGCYLSLRRFAYDRDLDGAGAARHVANAIRFLRAQQEIRDLSFAATMDTGGANAVAGRCVWSFRAFVVSEC